MSMSPQKIAKEIMDFCFVTSFILLEFQLLSLFHSIQFFLSIFAGISFNRWQNYSSLRFICDFSFFLMEPRICELQNEFIGKRDKLSFFIVSHISGLGLVPMSLLNSPALPEEVRACISPQVVFQVIISKIVISMCNMYT